jgi:hypothetical protein
LRDGVAEIDGDALRTATLGLATGAGADLSPHVGGGLGVDADQHQATPIAVVNDFPSAHAGAPNFGVDPAYDEDDEVWARLGGDATPAAGDQDHEIMRLAGAAPCTRRFAGRHPSSKVFSRDRT